MSNIVAIVPARAGSKGLVNKNGCIVGGKSLVEWAVSYGMSHPLISDTIISTDSTDYLERATAAGAYSFGLRPESLSGDTVKSIDVVLDVLQSLHSAGRHVDNILLLQPTTPERTPNELTDMYNLLSTEDCHAVVSVSLLEEPHPYSLKSLNLQGYIKPFISQGNSESPRQAYPSCWELTGAYYLIKTAALRHEHSLLPKKSKAYVTPKRVNINTQDDLDYLAYRLDHGISHLI